VTTGRDVDAALARLPSDARARLDEFSRALDRVHVDDLPLYVARQRQPRHRRAVETAELVAIEGGLAEPLEAARNVVVELVIRMFTNAQFRVWIGGVAMAPNAGPAEEHVRIARSVADAVTALVLGDRLEPDVHGELLGLWDRLLP
jgi:hypothetical protein